MSAKRYLLFALSFAIAMTVFTAFAPRAVHAITATLVQVVNTSATPVPTSDSATQFDTTVCRASGTVSVGANLCGAVTGTFVVPTTTSTGATVRRLVIDNFNGVCSNFNNPVLHIFSVRLTGPFMPDNVNQGQSAITNWAPVSQPYSYVNAPDSPSPYQNVPENDYSFGQNTHWVYNAGDTVRLDMFAFAPNFGSPGSVFDGWCTASVIGHLVTN